MSKPLLPAHSETVGAGSKMPAPPRMRVLAGRRVEAHALLLHA